MSKIHDDLQRLVNLLPEQQAVIVKQLVELLIEKGDMDSDPLSPAELAALERGTSCPSLVSSAPNSKRPDLVKARAFRLLLPGNQWEPIVAGASANYRGEFQGTSETTLS